jgi:hypothetical protein
MFSYLLACFWFNLWFCRRNCRLLFLWREVEAVDGSLRTSFLTLPTHLALLCIDVGEVVYEGNRLELLASLYALAATDTGCLTSLVGDGSLVLIVAENDDTTAFGTFQTDFDDASRAGFRASATSRALLFVNLWKTSFLVHVESIELTFGYTITTSEATIAASSLAHTSHLLNSTTLGSIELCLTRTILAGSVTTNDCHFRSTHLDSHAENTGHLFHNRLTAYRTELALQASLVSRFHTSSCKARATWVATTATIGLRQNGSDLGNARIFMHSKLVRDQEKDYRRGKSYQA